VRIGLEIIVQAIHIELTFVIIDIRPVVRNMVVGLDVHYRVPINVALHTRHKQKYEDYHFL